MDQSWIAGLEVLAIKIEADKNHRCQSTNQQALQHWRPEEEEEEEEEE